MVIQTIETFTAFADIVNSLPFEYCLSRGQSADLPLLPTALRTDSSGNRMYSKSSADSFLDDFKIDAVHFIERPIGIPNEHEWQVYAQHFGVPTRLLDFTSFLEDSKYSASTTNSLRIKEFVDGFKILSD